MDLCSTIKKTICPILAPNLAVVIEAVPDPLLAQASEIRLRVGQPLRIIAGGEDVAVGRDGQPARLATTAYRCTRDDLAQTLKLISKNSIYAYEEELRLGFLTVAGGHRIGLAGQAIINHGELVALKNIGAMNIRLAREVLGSADLLTDYVVAGKDWVHSTLIIAPPRCGKTTILRDLVRQISGGIPRLDFAGVQVGLVDERSEIAACQDGVSTTELGPRTDVLDGCPKASGMLMLIRAMAPRVVVTDELGREADALAIREALHAGVSVIASVHGRSVADISGRPYIGELVAEARFDRYIVLSDTPRVGTVEEIIAVADGEVLYRRRKGVRVCG